jgi:hypothetical protein
VAQSARTRLCLTCRTLLGDEEPCDLGHGGIASLDAPLGRTRIAEEVWSTGTWARTLRARYRVLPNGVPSPDIRKRHEGVTGVVHDDLCAVAPGSGRECVAWQIVLKARKSRLGHVMLIDAETVGFTVLSDHGEVVRVPAGRLRIVSPPAARLAEPDGRAFIAWFDDLEPRPDPSFPLFPHDAVHENVVRAGDRVEVEGPFDDLTGAARGYRELPQTVLVPRGIPRVRILPPW